MNERQWERLGAGAGIAFVILLLVTIFMVPQPPHIDAPTAKIVSYVAGHRRAILASSVVGTFAIVAFLWFVGHLRHVLERAEGGVEALSPIVFGAGVALAAVAFVAGIPMTILALMAGQANGLTDGNLVRMVFDMNQITGGMIGIVIAAFLVPAGYAMVRKELVAPWLGWVAFVVSGISAVGGAAGMTLSTYSSAWNLVGFIGLLGSMAVVLLACIAMEWQPETSRAATRPPVFAPSA